MYAPHRAPMRYNPYAHNPLSRGAKIAIGVGAAVVIGGATYLLWPSSASAAEPLPAPPTGGGGGGGGGGTPPSTGGGTTDKITAPPYPSAGQAAESVWIDAAMAKHCDAVSGTCNIFAEQLRNIVWSEIYGDVVIPPAAQQGAGWAPWTAASQRILAGIADRMPYGQTVLTGGQKKVAPKWPPEIYSVNQAKTMETLEAGNAVIQNCDYATKTCPYTVEQLASKAWNAIPGYKGVKVPAASKAQGGHTGAWKPWIDAYKRIVAEVIKQLNAIGASPKS